MGDVTFLGGHRSYLWYDSRNSIPFLFTFTCVLNYLNKQGAWSVSTEAPISAHADVTRYAKDLLNIYLSVIRPVLEYACPVWHLHLPKYLCDSIQCIQNRALRCIYPGKVVWRTFKWPPHNFASGEKGLNLQKIFQHYFKAWQQTLRSFPSS